MESPQEDDVDDASCLSYFSSFNRQSFETGDTNADASNVEPAEGADVQTEKVPHPPMRSTITPINIAMPATDFRPTPKQAKSQSRRTPKSSSPQSTPSPNGNPLAITAGPIASLVTQHNHSMISQLRGVPVTSQPMPTIVLQPVLLNLSAEQQVLAAQLQERFFTIISQAGQNGQGPLAIVAPNLQNLTPPASVPAFTPGFGLGYPNAVPAMLPPGPHYGQLFCPVGS